MSAHWQRVRTTAGYHARLKGGNNETVLHGEPVDDPRNVIKAILAAHEAFSLPVVEASVVEAMIDDVDERPANIHYIAETGSYPHKMPALSSKQSVHGTRRKDQVTCGACMEHLREQGYRG